MLEQDQDQSVPALGTILRWRPNQPANPVAFREISELTGITPPSLKTIFADTTKQKGKFKTKKPTKKEVGPLKFEINYSAVNADHQHEEGGIMWAWANDILSDFEVEDADGQKEYVTGWIGEIARTYEKENVQKGDITVEVTGAPTL